MEYNPFYRNANERVDSKLRFKILERDNFTCQYCGRKAPDVILEVDHIRPVCLGGDNRESNLITSCSDCNQAKGTNRVLSKENEADKEDFDNRYREKVREYGYYTNYIKKIFKNNDRNISRPRIHKFTQRSFKNDKEFEEFKQDIRGLECGKIVRIVNICNIKKISYSDLKKEYLQGNEK